MGTSKNIIPNEGRQGRKAWITEEILEIYGIEDTEKKSEEHTKNLTEE